MSYNVWALNEDTAALAAVIRQEQPDILLLQEATTPIINALNFELAGLYPGGRLHIVHQPNMGQAIISRYPLTALDSIYNKGRVQKVVTHTPNGPINIWNVHPHAPRVWWYQYKQISALTDDIVAVDGPLIVGGDFNTTDQAETYHLVNQHLRNAHWEAGWGFGFSWPAHAPRIKRVPIITPMIRIDHIFYNDHFFVRMAKTLSDSGGSDHFPVVAELLRIE
jgi:endonuclease/exonuclease/phosphatase (EEP) superfamily protein YafD